MEKKQELKIKKLLKDVPTEDLDIITSMLLDFLEEHKDSKSITIDNIVIDLSAKAYDGRLLKSFKETGYGVLKKALSPYERAKKKI